MKLKSVLANKTEFLSAGDQRHRIISAADTLPSASNLGNLVEGCVREAAAAAAEGLWADSGTETSFLLCRLWALSCSGVGALRFFVMSCPL
mmetsp:Transcript_53816/g.105268  ORF Transcript_53816/g.105268 Transcript_53816/m.105268 type:complete len:91 (-) Transcript_53816:97-369(-)